MTELTPGCRHCAVCDREIMDFSMKTDAEVLAYLQRNTGKICGRFSPQQLERPLLEPRMAKRSALTAIAASFAALMAAQNPVNGQAASPVGTEQIPEPDEREVLGKMAYFDFLEPDSMRTISGKVLTESGQPFHPVTVYFSRTDFHVICEKDGSFQLKIPLDTLKNNPLEIHIGSPGFDPKTVLLSDRILTEDIALSTQQTEMGMDQMKMGDILISTEGFNTRYHKRSFWKRLFPGLRRH